MKKNVPIALLLAGVLLLTGCSTEAQNNNTDKEVAGSQNELSTGISDNGENQESGADTVNENAGSENADEAAGDASQAEFDPADCFKGMTITKSYKSLIDSNPIMTQRFGADPFAMVYGDRVYFYMTADAFEYDAAGAIKDNSYSKIASINVVSTDDMINFTDHGSIKAAGRDGAATWAKNSWAPAAAWKNIDGKDKFFLYFADNGGGIGVLTADSPEGPFTDPLGHALISRSTPTCAEVLWLFDPAVLVDDDGRAYIYFGGGVPDGKAAAPGTARCAELGDDMISLKCDPVAIDVPYLFEDSGIHKYGDTYYYSYCTNFSVDAEGTEKYGFGSGEICTMESKNPLGPFTFKERILENPGKYCGLGGNNHHAVFNFKDRWYITYHNRALEKAMGVQKGYRCTNIEEFTMGEDGTIGTIRQTKSGREQLKYVDPYQENTAVNAAVLAGLNTVETSENGKAYMVIDEINTGDLIKIVGVDFGTEAPRAIEMMVTVGVTADDAVIRINAGLPNSEAVAYVPVRAAQGEATENGFAKVTVELQKELTGVNDLCIVFAGEGYQLKSWRFVK